MNVKLKELLKNFSYSISTNLFSLFVSVMMVVIVPKILGVKEYSYWQLYILYISYVGFFHFGLIDGIYLRYGGSDYKDLNRELFRSQFWLLCLFETIICSCIIIYSYFCVTDVNRLIIISIAAINCVIMNARWYLLYILQVTNRFKEYARANWIERILYILFVIVVFSLNIKNYSILLVIDVIVKTISLFYCIFICKDIVFGKLEKIKISITEIRLNISAGCKLLIANIAGILIIGIIRFAIENKWGVELFGKVSLSISISNMLITFLSAIGIVLYPLLRRTSKEKLPQMYETIHVLLITVMAGLLLFYYPLKSILTVWLPKYADTFKYMALLFPMCIFEGKVSLLINTYMNVLRKEKTVLIVNLITVAASLLMTTLSVYIFQKLSLAVLSIVILLGFRCIIGEIILARYLKRKASFDIILMLIIASTFILINWYIDSWLAFGLYFIVYMLYLGITAKSIKNTIGALKLIMKGNA